MFFQKNAFETLRGPAMCLKMIQSMQKNPKKKKKLLHLFLLMGVHNGSSRLEAYYAENRDFSRTSSST